MSKQICDIDKSNKQLMFAQNLEKGRIAEKIAIEDYENHGFKVTRTGVGSDFVAEKLIEGNDKLYREFVEVKAGYSPLSKLQKITKSRMKKEGIVYSEYIVSDPFIENYLEENTIQQIPNFELRELIPENWKDDEKYRINLPGICPHCGVSVETLDGLITKFGLRKMSDDTIRNQSWCRICRNILGWRNKK